MKLSDLKPGDRIAGFEHFGCIPDYAIREVKVDPNNGRLFVDCDKGGHYLDGQKDKRGELIGLFIATPEAMRDYRKLLRS